MKSLIDELDSIKKIFVKRASEVLDDVVLGAFISALDDYHEKAAKIINKETKEVTEVKDENAVLRSISGISEIEMRAKLLESGQEIRFLRKQLLEVKKSWEKKCKENDTIRLDFDVRRNEFKEEKKAAKNEQKNIQKEVGALQEELDKLEEKIKGQKDEMASEGRASRRKLMSLEMYVRQTVNSEVVAVISRLRNLCGVILGTSQFCVEQWGKTEKDLPKTKKKGIRLDVLKIGGSRPLSEISPDLDLIIEFSEKAVKTLDQYMELLSPLEPNLGRMYWSVFWNNLQRKYFSVMIKKQVSITWPSEKKYPIFVTDEKMLYEACEAIVQNALDAISVKETLDIKGEFSEEKCVLTFTDTGRGVEPEDRDNIFLPFFTNKSGRQGLGLTKALKLIRALGGTLNYKPLKKGSQFVVVLKGH